MINLVGLGPGDPRHVTLEAMETLDSSDVIFVRGGKHHPVAQALAAREKNVQLLGALYHIGMSHSDVYDVISDIVLTASRMYPSTTYAVPGNIFVFETACDLIRRRAEAAKVPVKLVPGISSIEAIYANLGIDPGDGMAILHGDRLERTYSPRLATILVTPWNKLDPEGVERVRDVLLAHLAPDHPITIVANVGFETSAFTRVDGALRDLPALARGVDPDWASCYIPARAR